MGHEFPAKKILTISNAVFHGLLKSVPWMLQYISPLDNLNPSTRKSTPPLRRLMENTWRPLANQSNNPPRKVRKLLSPSRTPVATSKANEATSLAADATPQATAQISLV